MQPVEIRHHQKHLAPERLQAAAGVAGAVAQDGVAHAVGDARLDLLEAGILAPDPLAGGKADALAAIFDRRNQVRQERRIVLAVAVERRHDGAARGTHAAAHRRRLARRSRVTDLAQIAALLHLGRKPLGGRIRRAVIDVDDFIGPSAIERGGDFGDQRADVLGLVAHGDDDGNGHRGCVRRRQINARRWSGPSAGDACRPAGLRRPLLMGPRRPRATLLRCPETLRSGTISPSRRIAKPRRRAANQYRTAMAPTTPIKRARDHVARMMGEQHQAAGGDQERIDDHRGPRARPKRGHRESQRKGRDGMRRRKAGIGLGSGKGREVEGVGLAADERPAASDDPFDRLRRRAPAPAPRKTETADAVPKPSQRAIARFPARPRRQIATTSSIAARAHST